MIKKLIICDKCGKEEIITDAWNNGYMSVTLTCNGTFSEGKITYDICPKCKKKYGLIKDNKYGFMLQDEPVLSERMYSLFGKITVGNNN